MTFLQRVALVCSFLAGMYATPVLHAQAPSTGAPKFLIFADTAGVSRVAPDTYITWVFAKATPTSLPSSGVLVAFDCASKRVKRIAHVVYHLAADSVSVEGAIVEDTTGWVPVSNPRLFNVVCEVGPKHGIGDGFINPTIPGQQPNAPKGGWSQT